MITNRVLRQKWEQLQADKPAEEMAEWYRQVAREFERLVGLKPRPLTVVVIDGEPHVRCPVCGVDEDTPDIALSETGAAMDRRWVEVKDLADKIVKSTYTETDWWEVDADLECQSCGALVEYPEGWEVDYA